MVRAAVRLPERCQSPAHAAAVVPSAPAVDAMARERFDGVTDLRDVELLEPRHERSDTAHCAR